MEDVGFRQKIEADRLIFADLLHRPFRMEAGVLGQVDGGHAAFADLMLDLVCVIESCKLPSQSAAESYHLSRYEALQHHAPAGRHTEAHRPDH